ncbi:hypothetical protein Tco_1117961 [Tanacetum coccineum]
MASTQVSTSKTFKRQKITIIPPRQLSVDLTKDDDKTPLQQQKISSPNAPSKTPSTKATSSSSIASKLNSPASSSLYSTSPSTTAYLNLPNLPPLRVPPSLPAQDNASLNITLTLSLITPLDFQFNSPSPLIPSPPILGHPILFNLLEAHGVSCLCCLHN